MKNEWKRKTLGDVAQITAGNPAPQDQALFKDGTYPFFRTADAGRIRFGEIYESADHLNEDGVKGLRRFPKGTILFPKSGASTFLNHRVMLGVEGCVSSHLAAIIADEKQVDPRFLLNFLATIEAQDLVQDHAYPSLNLPTIAGIGIQVPSLSEQQRIVSVLDEACDGIAEAKANTERNLENVRAVFQAELHAAFAQRRDGWIDTTIGDQLMLQRGFDITKAQQKEGNVPVVSSGGVRSFHDIAMVRAPGVVIGRKGTLGKVFYLEDDFWPHDTTLWVKQFNGNDPRFVYYFFAQLDVTRLDSGTANPALNRNQVHPIEVLWPPIGQQKVTAKFLDDLVVETQRLESIYEKKLAALESLRRSLLHRAFAGAL